MQGDWGGVNPEEPPQGVRTGVTCEQEATQTQEQHSPSPVYAPRGQANWGACPNPEAVPLPPVYLQREWEGTQTGAYGAHAHCSPSLYRLRQKKSP